MAINKQIILGYVGQEPKVINFGDGGVVAKISVAATEKGYTLQNGTQVPEHTQWFSCKCTGNLAGVIRDYVHKGSKIYVEGKTHTRVYIDNNNQQRAVTEVLINAIELCDSRPQTQTAPQQASQQTAAPQQQTQQTQTAAETTPPTDDGLPF